MAAAKTNNMVIFAGGTGGHIYPALAVARELAARGYAIHWFGSDRGLENRVVPVAGFTLNILPAQGLRGRGGGARLKALQPLLKSVWQAYRIMRNLKPVCALGMGGYVAGPASIAAWLMGIPLVIHEQNAVAGTTNRILRRFASRILCAYPNPYPGSSVGIEVGNPVRRELLDRDRRAGYDFNGRRPLHLLVVGGSQGARALNEVVPRALALLPPGLALRLRHQTGERHLQSVKLAYGKLSYAAVEILPFIEDMAAAYDWADLVLCRAGALTLAEMTVMSRPSILVPLPAAIDDHQRHNAEWLAQRGGACVIPQSSLNPQALATQLQTFIANPAQLSAMADAAGAAAQPGATRAVADSCEMVKHEC